MDRLKGKLVADWRDWSKWWSSRLAMVAGALGAVIVLAPNVALDILNAMPPETRAALSPVVGFAIFGSAMVTRLWKQRSTGATPPAPTTNAE